MGDIIQKITHFNVPQQQAWVVNANKTVAILGRGTGKDHGIIAPVVLRNAKGMPRGATGFVVPTYVKAKNDMVPALIKALEKFGFYQGIDFWWGQEIPSQITHERAYEHPGDPQYSIFWRNGHVNRIIGLDYKKSANGQSNDYIILNEARFISEQQFKDRVKPTNRGNDDIAHFTRLHYHHGNLIASDRPMANEGRWFLDWAKQMDPDQINLIVAYDQEERQYRQKIMADLLSVDPQLPATIEHDRDQLLEVMRDLVLKDKLHSALEKRFRKELHRLEQRLFVLRRNATFVVEASTLDNIDVVREDYIDEMFHDLGPKLFRVRILNLDDDVAEDAFYSTFSEEHHTYDDINYDYIEMFPDGDLPQPWKKDGDLATDRALHMGLDFNRRITCVVIGQEFTHCFRMLNALNVKDPLRIKDLAKLVDDYYRGFPFKKIVLHYDHTATGQDSSKEIGFATDFKNAMIDLGWIVEENYIGRTIDQSLRHKLFKRVYAEDDAKTKAVRINRTNCKHELENGGGYGGLIPSITNCGAYDSKNAKGQTVTKKDKAPELSKTYPPEQAPHFSDAHDTLYIGVFLDRIAGDDNYETDFVL